MDKTKEEKVALFTILAIWIGSLGYLANLVHQLYMAGH
jgi:hypothetical protein